MNALKQNVLRVLYYYFKIWIVLISGLFILLLIFYLFIYFPHKKQSQTNLQNLEKIEYGMSNLEVIEIMGKENLKMKNVENDSVYLYEFEPLSSEDIEVIFDREMKVKRINFR
jgi:hypothetical protein